MSFELFYRRLNILIDFFMFKIVLNSFLIQKKNIIKFILFIYAQVKFKTFKLLKLKLGSKVPVALNTQNL